MGFRVKCMYFYVFETGGIIEGLWVVRRIFREGKVGGI